MEIEEGDWFLVFMLGVFIFALGASIAEIKSPTRDLGNMICSNEGKGDYAGIRTINNNPIVKCYRKENLTNYDGGYIEEVTRNA